MNRQKLQRMLVTSASSLIAIIVALAICAVILLITGKDPVKAFSTLFGAAELHSPRDLAVVDIQAGNDPPGQGRRPRVRQSPSGRGA